MDIKETIYNYLVQNGASRFWADRAVENIMPQLNTNRFFAVEVSDPRHSCFCGRLKTFKCKATLRLPSGEDFQAKVEYSFRPMLKRPHQIKVSVV